MVFEAIKEQVRKDFPDLRPSEVTRSAYAKLESELDASVVRQGQLEGAINAGRVPEFRLLSGIGWGSTKWQTPYLH